MEDRCKIPVLDGPIDVVFRVCRGAVRDGAQENPLTPPLPPYGHVGCQVLSTEPKPILRLGNPAHDDHVAPQNGIRDLEEEAVLNEVHVKKPATALRASRYHLRIGPDLGLGCGGEAEQRHDQGAHEHAQSAAGRGNETGTGAGAEHAGSPANGMGRSHTGGTGAR